MKKIRDATCFQHVTLEESLCVRTARISFFLFLVESSRIELDGRRACRAWDCMNNHGRPRFEPLIDSCFSGILMGL